MGYNSVADNMGLFSFVYPLLAPKSRKSREIQREFELIAGLGHPRSLVLMSIETAYTTSYYSLIVTLTVSPTILEILMFKARKWLVLPPLPCLTPRLGGTPWNFLMKLTK